MNKSDLVAAIAEKAEMSKKDAEKALKAFDCLLYTSSSRSRSSVSHSSVWILNSMVREALE